LDRLRSKAREINPESSWLNLHFFSHDDSGLFRALESSLREWNGIGEMALLVPAYAERILLQTNRYLKAQPPWMREICHKIM
jgi:hypothetical protein